MGLNLGSILGGGLGSAVKDIVGAFKLDPAKKAEFQAAVDENAALIRQKELELEAKVADQVAAEIQAASANIRAEATSGDKYTARARPTFLYMMELILFANYIVLPLIGRPPISFPEALFWLFGSCMLGYTGARTWEKIGTKQ